MRPFIGTGLLLLLLTGCALPHTPRVAAQGTAEADAESPGGRPALMEQIARLPAALAGFRRGPVTNFEARAPGFGQGVEYTASRRAAVATVAVYDRGYDRVPANPADPAQVAELDLAVRDATVLPPRTTGRTLAEESRAPLPAAGGPDLTCADLAGTFGRTPIRRTVCVGGARGRFVTIQVTMPDRTPSIADAHAFAAAAAAAVRGG